MSFIGFLFKCLLCGLLFVNRGGWLGQGIGLKKAIASDPVSNPCWQVLHSSYPGFREISSSFQGHTILSTEGGRRFANGSLVSVSTADGTPKKILILSDYFMGHRAHVALMRKQGWNNFEFIHRGEYFVDGGKILRVNSTSGEVFNEGVSQTVQDVKSHLEKTALVTTETHYEEFQPGAEHLYPGFNIGEPRGKVHSPRELLDRAVSFTEQTLAAKLPETLRVTTKIKAELNGEPHYVERMLNHWELLLQGVSGENVAGLTALRRGLEAWREGGLPPENEWSSILLDVRFLKKRFTSYEILELVGNVP